MKFLRKFYWLIGPNGIILILISYLATSLYQNFNFKKLKKNNQKLEFLNKLNNNHFVKIKTDQLGLESNLLKQEFTKFSKINSGLNDRKKFWVSYLNTKDEKIEAAKLFINKKVVYLAANYLNSTPILYSIKYFKTIKNEESSLSHSQLWHLDTTHKKIFKIFWSPFGVSSLQGPTTICKTGKKPKMWQFSNYPNFPSYFTDEEFKKSRLSKFETDEILLEPNELSICDTCNLFHYGSRFNHERWIVILEFASFKRYDYFHKPDEELEEINSIITSMI